MRIEDQVTSLEIAKKLKELGVKQESVFCYANENIILTHREVTKQDQSWSAFTASELITMIPHMIDTKQNEPFNNFRFNMQIAMIHIDGEFKKCYLLNYHCDSWAPEEPFFIKTLFQPNIYDPNLSEAIAKLLIYLIEHGLHEMNTIPGFKTIKSEINIIGE